ncbi:hypothetical protein GQ457_08G027220 [Hibiscus cannabinus]
MIEKGVDLRLRDWNGKTSMKVIPLDEYDFVIGLSFLDRINTLVLPYVDCLCTLDPRQQCIIPVSREVGKVTKALKTIQSPRRCARIDPKLLSPC